MTAVARWEHFHHQADVGVRGLGPTRPQAFEQAALVMTAVVTDLALVQAREAVPIQRRCLDPEILLTEWLNAIVYEMATRHMLFGRFEVRIDGDQLEGRAWGEPVDVARHHPAVEVKGATLTQLRVVGSTGAIRLSGDEMDAMLRGGAQWAVGRGWGRPEDLDRTEEHGRMAGAEPDKVSEHAKKRQRDEMGTLGSGNHYLEVQHVVDVFDGQVAGAFGIHVGDIVVSIHCGSRGLGHQIGTKFLRDMALEAQQHGIALPDRELACAPINSATGRAYLGAMRSAINCALANRQILTHLTREAFAAVAPRAQLALLYDVSHNTCKVEEHVLDGQPRQLYVHRKGATRAFGPGHPDLPAALRDAGQPVLIGGSMGTSSYILGGTRETEQRAFSSACHGAGRSISRNEALRRYRGRSVVDDLAGRGILIRSPSMRGVAEEAPGAYKDVSAVCEAADHAGLARLVARLEPVVCVKG